MKVGILTLHKANNYGAVLQTYALQKYLLAHNIKAEVIDFRPNVVVNKAQRSLINKMLKILSEPVDYIIKKRKQGKFNDFRNNYINISKTTFFGDEQISKNPPFYDLFIVGSDQIWNTDITHDSKAFFLNFVQKGHKISYAASLGKDDFSETEKKYIKEYLGSFEAISVREKLLQKKLNTEFSIHSEHVLDPVFLLDKEEWLEIASEIRLPKEYVLCYMMEYSQELIDHTKQVASQKNCTPLFISLSNSSFSGKKLKNIGPTEFIYIFVNARYICTNSFHGTAFSLLFKKDFTVVRHSRLNSRISNLIELVGLKKRFLDDANHTMKEIEYMNPTEKLRREINKSQEYLRNIFYSSKGIR